MFDGVPVAVKDEVFLVWKYMSPVLHHSVFSFLGFLSKLNPLNNVFGVELSFLTKKYFQEQYYIVCVGLYSYITFYLLRSLKNVVLEMKYEIKLNTIRTCAVLYLVRFNKLYTPEKRKSMYNLKYLNA